MHIALLTHHYAPETGAPQRRWGALVPRFIAAGHRVTVLTPPPHYPSGHAEALTEDQCPGAVSTGEHGERIVRVRFREHGPGLVSRTADQSVAAIDSVLRSRRHLGRNGQRPDVVIATVPGIPSIWAGVMLRHLLHAPLVVEMRDAWPDLIEPSKMLGDPRRPGWQAVATTQVHRAMTHMQRGAAAIVTTTEAFADVLRDRGMSSVEVVRNGSYLEEVPHLGRREDDGSVLRVLYLGTVGRAQGLPTSLQAVRLLRERGTEVSLRIVGPGVDYPYLLEQATKLAVPVDLRGPVPRCDVFDHYAWADSLLVPLRSWTPLRWTVPSKLYDVLATGRHVTGVLAGEAAEIVESTGAGHVVPPEEPEQLADLWARLSADRSLLDVGPGGREWALAHSDYDELAEHYLQVLEDVRR